ncbi:unnamed protein product [Moneuplotes crassus]|uniref:Uncharacterized protein n=1 Tax=Euplotes crassus TaxID=5936 RepID=A0AAD1YA92_EUPCR|nr:unnamed protein product [Moneuplotes crassus]
MQHQFQIQSKNKVKDTRTHLSSRAKRRGRSTNTSFMSKSKLKSQQSVHKRKGSDHSKVSTHKRDATSIKRENQVDISGKDNISTDANIMEALKLCSESRGKTDFYWKLHEVTLKVKDYVQKFKHIKKSPKLGNQLQSAGGNLNFLRTMELNRSCTKMPSTLAVPKLSVHKNSKKMIRRTSTVLQSPLVISPKLSVMQNSYNFRKEKNNKISEVNSASSMSDKEEKSTGAEREKKMIKCPSSNALDSMINSTLHKKSKISKPPPLAAGLAMKNARSASISINLLKKETLVTNNRKPIKAVDDSNLQIISSKKSEAKSVAKSKSGRKKKGKHFKPLQLKSTFHQKSKNKKISRNQSQPAELSPLKEEKLSKEGKLPHIITTKEGFDEDIIKASQVDIMSMLTTRRSTVKNNQKQQEFKICFSKKTSQNSSPKRQNLNKLVNLAPSSSLISRLPKYTKEGLGMYTAPSNPFKTQRASLGS